MNDRIKQIQMAMNMSQKDFAEAIGITPGALSNIYSNRTNATGNHVRGIHKAFPRIDINWLMFGEGNMYGDSEDKSLQSNDVRPGFSLLGDQEGSAGSADLFSAPEMDVDSHAMPPRATGRDIVRKDRQFTNVAADGTVHRNALATEMYNNTKILDKLSRKVKEIRVFFDDGTYETFLPGK